MSAFKLFVSRRQLLSLGASALAVGSLAGCGGASSSDGEPSKDIATGDVTQLTVEPGKLTVATGQPAWEPWVMNDNPESGEGFEAALIYAIAEKLGFDEEDVVWVRSDFGESFAPGQHDWDLNIQQISINEDRKKAVDFSPAYFRTTQSIATLKKSDYAKATSLADFEDAVIAVQAGSTAYDYVKTLIKGGSEEGIDVFNDNADAAAAVSNGQADAIVTDTTDIVYMTSSDQIKDGVVVGQIPGSEDPDGLGITLAKDSPLTPFVTDILTDLIDDGTVDVLIETWLAEYTSDIPFLTA
ncbi:MAG: amino acid ABC transporter substrate-binding protein [Atopobiaceae bacterium]|nr:amino acid ABC transporter substrate-binding protein [Atopobiaceae bacterium]